MSQADNVGSTFDTSQPSETSEDVKFYSQPSPAYPQMSYPYPLGVPSHTYSSLGTFLPYYDYSLEQLIAAFSGQSFHGPQSNHYFPPNTDITPPAPSPHPAYFSRSNLTSLTGSISTNSSSFSTPLSSVSPFYSPNLMNPPPAAIFQKSTSPYAMAPMLPMHSPPPAVPFAYSPVQPSMYPLPEYRQSAPTYSPSWLQTSLLDDFRNGRGLHIELSDILGHVLEFAMDQNGSRFIQQKLEVATPSEKMQVFCELLQHCPNLMMDVFGNYVIQKFFDLGSVDQKQRLLDKMDNLVLTLSLHVYGCRVVQKVLEVMDSDAQNRIMDEIKDHVVRLVKDQNGNHVIQKCVECVPPKQLDFIVDAVTSQVPGICCHAYGCRVIQRLLEHCSQEQCSVLLSQLHLHVCTLVTDQYANYVIQHVLEHGRTEDKSRIVNSLRGRVADLSVHKFASNVMEKAVAYASRGDRAQLIQEILDDVAVPSSVVRDPLVAPAQDVDQDEEEEEDMSTLWRLMKDPYGNYVVQKMLDMAEVNTKTELMRHMQPRLPRLQGVAFGKHLINKMDKHSSKVTANHCLQGENVDSCAVSFL